MSDIQNIMKFEFLPNEILIECFEYFNAFDLFYSFDQLNYRINNLIQNLRLSIDLKNINKTIFDYFCTKMLLNPGIKSQIYSLQLSDEHECLPKNTFLSFFSINEFVNLQKFEWMVSSTNSKQPVCLICENLFNKINLTDLLFSKIQTLSIVKIDQYFQDIHKISSVINLTINNCNLRDLYVLFKYIPMLKYLHIKHFESSRYSNDSNINFSNTYASHLKQMMIDHYISNFNTFEMFIRQTPNLKSLTIATLDNIDMINAYQWKQLIISLLPYLTIFKFKFGYCFCRDELSFVLDKFQEFETDFWQKQHHWYTEYIKGNGFAFIYTIPYISNTFELTSNYTKYSNDSINNVNTFMNVTDLSLDINVLTDKYQYYFSNVRFLTLNLTNSKPLTINHNTYLKMILSLFNLKHLHIRSRSIMENSTVLLEILKEAPSLSSLTINTLDLKSFLNDRELCKYLKIMIKRLYIANVCLDRELNFDQLNQFYEIFSNLEHLQCKIDQKNYLFFLLNRLRKLSTVNLQWKCEYDHATELSQFQDKTQKLNVIFGMFEHRLIGYYYSLNDLEKNEHIVTKVFIWIGKNRI